MMEIFPDGMDNSPSKYAQSFLTSHVDRLNRRYQFDLRFDQSYVVELPCTFNHLGLRDNIFIEVSVSEFIVA